MSGGPCDITDGKWGCILGRNHAGPHRNSEGVCIGPWVACYVPPVSMYEVIHEWLAENMPRALELCPYKVKRADHAVTTDEETCYICGKPRNGPGGLVCSYPHPPAVSPENEAA